MRRDEFLYSYCAIQSRAQIRLEQSEKYNSAKIFAVLENKESFLLYCAERGTVDKGCFEEDDNGIFVFSKTAGKREEHFIPYAAIQRISAEITIKDCFLWHLKTPPVWEKMAFQLLKPSKFGGVYLSLMRK